MHMNLYCFTCSVHDELGQTQVEDDEIHNGMRRVWLNIYEATKHNENTIKNGNKKGLSVEPEAFLLKLIVDELIYPFGHHLRQKTLIFCLVEKVIQQ